MLCQWNHSDLHHNCIHEYLSLHRVYYYFLTRETTLFATYVFSFFFDDSLYTYYCEGCYYERDLDGAVVVVVVVVVVSVPVFISTFIVICV
jgi:hypothetical protein